MLRPPPISCSFSHVPSYHLLDVFCRSVVCPTSLSPSLSLSICNSIFSFIFFLPRQFSFLYYLSSSDVEATVHLLFAQSYLLIRGVQRNPSCSRKRKQVQHQNLMNRTRTLMNDCSKCLAAVGGMDIHFLLRQQQHGAASILQS